MRILLPPGQAVLPGEGVVSAGTAGRGSCHTKPLLNRNPGQLPRARPGARLASQHAQQSCSPAPTERCALPTTP